MPRFFCQDLKTNGARRLMGLCGAYDVVDGVVEVGDREAGYLRQIPAYKELAEAPATSDPGSDFPTKPPATVSGAAQPPVSEPPAASAPAPAATTPSQAPAAATPAPESTAPSAAQAQPQTATVTEPPAASASASSDSNLPPAPPLASKKATKQRK